LPVAAAEQLPASAWRRRWRRQVIGRNSGNCRHYRWDRCLGEVADLGK